MTARQAVSLLLAGIITATIVGGGLFIYDGIYNGIRDKRQRTNIQAKSNYEKNFPKEKILTASAESYVRSKGKKLEDYEMVGVTARRGLMMFDAIEEVIPLNTEVVVDYKGISYNYNAGTALIPKRKAQ